MPPDRWERATEPVVRRVLSLWPDSLVVAAMKAGGGQELGMEAITEPFEILCGALRDEAHLHGPGIARARRRVVGLLATRGRTLRRVSEHPEIDLVPVPAPIVVCGLPGPELDRLVDLLLADERLRRPDDENALTGVHFASMSFELDWHVPAFVEWYDEADLVAGYGWLRRMLQSQDWIRPDLRTDARWVLSSMQHLEQLPSIAANFPDAVVVHLAEDDVGASVARLATVVAERRRRCSTLVDPSQIAKYWTWRADRMLGRHADQLAALGPGRVVEVSSATLRGDPAAVVAAITTRAGLVPLG